MSRQMKRSITTILTLFTMFYVIVTQAQQINCDYESDEKILTLTYVGVPEGTIILNLSFDTGDNVNVSPQNVKIIENSTPVTQNFGMVDVVNGKAMISNVSAPDVLRVGVADKSEMQTIQVNEDCGVTKFSGGKFPEVESFVGVVELAQSQIRWTLTFENPYLDDHQTPRLIVNDVDQGEMQSGFRLFGFGGREYKLTTSQSFGEYNGIAVYYNAAADSQEVAAINNPVILEGAPDDGVPAVSAQNVSLPRPGIEFTIVGSISDLAQLRLSLSTQTNFSKDVRGVDMEVTEDHLSYFLSQADANLQEGDRVTFQVTFNKVSGKPEFIDFHVSGEAPAI